jgi:putative membrane protein
MTEAPQDTHVTGEDAASVDRTRTTLTSSVETRAHESERVQDLAPRRTLMAAERTYLAWLRTGLGALAVAIAVGRVTPALLGGSHPRLGFLGVGYAVLGIFVILYSIVRARRLESAVASDASMTLDWWALVTITILGLGLAVATIVMVLTEI